MFAFFCFLIKGYSQKNNGFGLGFQNGNSEYSVQSAPDSLKPFYNSTKCGLNYTTAHVLIGKKMETYGLPYYGVDQPAPLIVSGIPSNAKIEKAYVWWDVTGSAITGSVTLQNPNSVSGTFSGTNIGSGTRCWGPSNAFRADVTNIILGNGTYYISGLPTDTTFLLNDANGASLFIIYSDSLSNYAGTLVINDGYVLVKQDTVVQTIRNLNLTQNLAGKAFILVSDLQNEPGNAIKMNNGAYLGVAQDFWDFEVKNTVYLNGQTTSTFGVSSPNDCDNILFIGAYYQSPYSLVTPTISQNLDTLTSSSANLYQWVFNGVKISGALNQKYLTKKSGTYEVIVNNGSSLCYIKSNAVNITTCNDLYKPNIKIFNDTLWTDSINNSFQWYRNSNPISGANSVGYRATQIGNYWVKATHSGGCIVNSDTINIYMLGVNDNYFTSVKVSVSPNPSSGNFLIDITSEKADLTNTEINILNPEGQMVYYSKLNSGSDRNFKQVSVYNISSGIYFLKINGKNFQAVKKIVIY